MENNLKVFKSDKFDVEDTTSLSLFLYPNSLAVFAKDNNQANIGIHFYTTFSWDKLDGLLVTDPLLKLDLPTKIYLHQPDFCLVPGVLFQPGKEETYLSFIGDLKKDNFYFSTPLDSNNIQLVSYLNGKAKKSLEARFSDLSFYHGGTSFLSYLFKERFNLIGQEILVCVFDQYIYLAAFTDQELSVFNIFEIQDKADILKYVSILIAQLNFDKNYVRISLFGATEQNGISEDWGKSYFHHFRMMTPHSNQNYPHGFKHLKSRGLFETYWQFD
ncbi:DUF3822 family protein [Algoriphagus halophilus]|uniref:DUF3822 domain-containing protein n=1 Tax=Algoriphagus halophilus TaxID=226505 RepID=A0A1N6DG60_9BACT|nr:DUF3822 family protein [Algoriphagus halophilus]SIN69782.1 Protein of unknown function [Algoriphagus halophilus]